MPTLAQPSDISPLLGVTFTTVQSAQCQAFIDQAEALIKLRYPNLTGLDAGTVKLVEIRAVRRVMLNPDAWENARIDDHSFKLNDAVAASEVEITDEEWAFLAPAESTASSESFSIKLASDGPSERYVRRPWE